MIIRNHGGWRGKAEREQAEAVHKELAKNGIHDYEMDRNGIGHIRITFYCGGKKSSVVVANSVDVRGLKNARAQIRRAINGRQHAGFLNDARG